MEEDLLRYKKFVAGIDEIATVLALEHLAAAGFRMDIFRTPEIGELAKLVETTWLGILIGWAQEASACRILRRLFRRGERLHSGS